MANNTVTVDHWCDAERKMEKNGRWVANAYSTNRIHERGDQCERLGNYSPYSRPTTAHPLMSLKTQ